MDKPIETEHQHRWVVLGQVRDIEAWRYEHRIARQHVLSVSTRVNLRAVAATRHRCPTPDGLLGTPMTDLAGVLGLALGHTVVLGRGKELVDYQVELTERVARAIQKACTGSDVYDAATFEHWIRCASQALDASLRYTYAYVRHHAETYRQAGPATRARAASAADPLNARAERQLTVHTWFERGLQAAARDLAELLDVPEHEIECWDNARG